MIVDAGARGNAAREALAGHPATEPLLAPGHFAFEIMSGLRAAANRPGHPFQAEDIDQALLDAESFEITMQATPWADVDRAWTLAQGSLRYPDAIYVAAAERHGVALLTSDARIEQSGAPMRCLPRRKPMREVAEHFRVHRTTVAMHPASRPPSRNARDVSWQRAACSVRVRLIR